MKRERKLKPGIDPANIFRDTEEGESLWLLDEDVDDWHQFKHQEEETKKND